MLRKGIVKKVKPSPQLVISNIFTKDKADETLRVILDLSEFITSYHSTLSKGEILITVKMQYIVKRKESVAHYEVRTNSHSTPSNEIPISTTEEISKDIETKIIPLVYS